MPLTCCWRNITSKTSNSLSYLKSRQFSVNNSYIIIKPEIKNNQGEPLQDVRYFRAKCNYTGFDHTELTFSIGDIIEVGGAYDRHYLYQARHLATGLIGFVSLAHLDIWNPIIELQPWYFNNITRIEATNILLDSSEVGNFLVRKSSNTTEAQVYSLSVVDEEDGFFFVKHYKICYGVNGYYISDGGYSKHLDLLIRMYQDDTDEELGIKITTPCIKDPRFSISYTDILE